MRVQIPRGAWGRVEAPKATQDLAPGGNTPSALLGPGARTWSQQGWGRGRGLGSSFPNEPQQLSTVSPWAQRRVRGPCGVSKGSWDGATSPSVGLAPTRCHRREVAPQREVGTEADTRGNDESLLLRSSQSPHGRRWTPLTHHGDFTARQNNTTRRGGRRRGAGPASHPCCPFPSPARGRGRAAPPCAPAAPRPPRGNPAPRVVPSKPNSSGVLGETGSDTGKCYRHAAHTTAPPQPPEAPHDGGHRARAPDPSPRRRRL